MENEARRRTVVRWRTDQPLERGRKGHPQARRQAPAKTSEISARFQTVSCSDDDRRSTHNPAQGANPSRTPDGPREGRDAGGIAWGPGADAGVHRRDEGTRPQQIQHAAPFLGTLNAYDWLQFIASHEILHMKQMREIAGSLQKIVTSLQKE